MNIQVYQKSIVSELTKLKTVIPRTEIINIQHTLEQIGRLTELPKANVFLTDGVYFRELTVPANRVVVGATHKCEHLFMVLKGKAKVISNYETLIVKAGHISKAPPFSKRIVITYEETTFANIHSNPENLTDLDELHTYYTEEDRLEKLEGVQKWLGQ